MKRSKKILATLVLFAVIAFTAPVSKAGIIVGFAKEGPTNEKCSVSKVDESNSAKVFDRGIIVGLTGASTRITVVLTSSDTTCGHLPTGD